ncbi:MAG: hypothetical protein ACN6OD_05230 [Alcaligenes sp.]
MSSTPSSTEWNDKRLAFAISCLFHDAIDRAEFRKWCIAQIGRGEVPSYVYDLLDFDEALFKIYQPIGYVPHWGHTKSDEAALYGIAITRGCTPFDIPVTPSAALAALGRAPEISSLFMREFSFIVLPPAPGAEPA